MKARLLFHDLLELLFGLCETSCRCNRWHKSSAYINVVRRVRGSLVSVTAHIPDKDDHNQSSVLRVRHGFALVGLYPDRNRLSPACAKRKKWLPYRNVEPSPNRTLRSDQTVIEKPPFPPPPSHNKITSYLTDMQEHSYEEQYRVV